MTVVYFGFMVVTLKYGKYNTVASWFKSLFRHFYTQLSDFPGFGPWSESSYRPVCPWIGFWKVTGHAWPVLNIMMIHNYERQLNICKAYIWRVLFNFLIHLRKWIPIQSHEPFNLNHLGELKMSRSITEILSQNIAVYGDREEFRGAREQTRDSKLSKIYPEIHLLSIQTVNNGLESIRRHTQIILSK